MSAGSIRRIWMLAALAAVIPVVNCGPGSREPQVTAGLQPINGTELYIKRMGAGEPVVFVHGGPLLEHGYFLPHLAPLADEYELIFYDQRLSGRSAAHVDSASVRIATFVDDIEAIRQALDLGRIHLIGHSWGGLIAMRYALRYEENLRSLLLLNSVSASSALWQEEERQLAQRATETDRREREAILQSEAFAARQPDAIRQLLLLAFRSQFSDTSRVAQLELYVPEDYFERGRQFAYMAPDLAEWELHEELAQLNVPIFIMYGADEVAVSLGGAAFHERLPQAEFVLVEDAGHFPFIEQPDAALDAVRAFLRGVK